ncbi:unnamed protein product, partial [marine sediment metagenome]
RYYVGCYIGDMVREYGSEQGEDPHQPTNGRAQ